MKVRKPLKITQRVSSVTNSFVQAIIPWIEPTTQEVAEALAVLGMAPDNIVCAYCGGVASDWDHLRPLVKGKRPTGYISEIRNLVPACGRCNQSKGGSDWRTWIRGPAVGSPRSRGIVDLDARIVVLVRFEEWGNVAPLPLRDWAGPALWDTHWANLHELEMKMKSAQEHAIQINRALEDAQRRAS